MSPQEAEHALSILVRVPVEEAHVVGPVRAPEFLRLARPLEEKLAVADLIAIVRPDNVSVGKVSRQAKIVVSPGSARRAPAYNDGIYYLSRHFPDAEPQVAILSEWPARFNRERAPSP